LDSDAQTNVWTPTPKLKFGLLLNLEFDAQTQVWTPSKRAKRLAKISSIVCLGDRTSMWHGNFRINWCRWIEKSQNRRLNGLRRLRGLNLIFSAIYLFKAEHLTTPLTLSNFPLDRGWGGMLNLSSNAPVFFHPDFGFWIEIKKYRWHTNRVIKSW